MKRWLSGQNPTILQTINENTPSKNLPKPNHSKSLSTKTLHTKYQIPKFKTLISNSLNPPIYINKNKYSAHFHFLNSIIKLYPVWFVSTPYRILKATTTVLTPIKLNRPRTKSIKAKKKLSNQVFGFFAVIAYAGTLSFRKAKKISK